ncbi:MAG TPA: hypothetical protein VJP02_01190 [Candidatus Sulfotelmatobacter sp.]|nr:hypothetical protein [Candidatus Sulfotelmatobacter sp.]
MKIVCVANFGADSMDFGRFIELLSTSTGVSRGDFPKSWDSRQNLLWYTESPKYIDGEEIKRRAARHWGEMIRNEPCVIVDFEIPVGHVGRIGFFELPTDVANRKLLRFNPVKFNWSVHGNFGNERKAILEDIKQLPWYETTRFILPSGLTDDFKYIPTHDKGLEFEVELHQEHEVRTIETSVGQIFEKHGLTFSQIAPATCPKCKGIIRMDNWQCLACAEKMELERKARQAAECAARETAERETKAERKLRRECTMCGRKLGFLDILRRSEQHKGCTSFIAVQNQKAS